MNVAGEFSREGGVGEDFGVEVGRIGRVELRSLASFKRLIPWSLRRA